MKRVTSFLLAIVLLAGFVMVGSPVVSAESAMTVSDDMIAVLKQEEGFASKPYWDYAQYTVGYGTVCPSDMVDYYMENGITEEEAELLLRNYLANTENTINKKFIDKYGLTLTQGQFDALVSFTYNCGSAWISETSGTFHNAVKNGATGSELIRAFSLWCSAGGKILPGLVRRRLSEANMYLNGEYSRSAPANYCYVYYNANGGSVSYKIQGYDANLGTAPAYTPSKSGSTFLGWYTAQVGGNKVNTLDQSLSGATLYAHWEDPVAEDNNAAEQKKEILITVTGSNVNLRKGPGTNYGIVGTANVGNQFKITETATGSGYTWGNDNGVWICLKYTNYDAVIAQMEQETTTPETTTPETTVPETTAPAAVTGTVKANGGLALRTGPGTGYSRVRYLSNGSRITIYEQQTVGSMVWGKTDGGWVSMSYVVLDAPVPETTVPPTTVPETTLPPETTEATTEATTEPTTAPSTEATTEPSTEATAEPTTAPSTEATTEPTTEPSTEATTAPSTEATTEPTTEETVPETTVPPTTVPEATAPVGVAGTVRASGGLALRTGPGTNYSRVRYLPNGSRVTVYEQQTVGGTTWGKLSEGWVSMSYVVLDSASSTPAPAPSSPSASGISGTVKAGGGLAVRNGPATSYSVRKYLSNGSKVTIYERQTVNGVTWGKVSDGWVCMNYIVLSGSNGSSAVKKTVTADCLRIRSAAGSGNQVVGYVYYGATVTIYETTTVNGSAWGRCDKGWVSMDYLK